MMSVQKPFLVPAGKTWLLLPFKAWGSTFFCLAVSQVSQMVATIAHDHKMNQLSA
jgi:hypothetical protein